MKRELVAVVASIAVAFAAVAHEEGEKHDEKAETGTVTVKGEILDMACYLSHGGSGEKHPGCAQTCIESGLPVGIKGEDGKTYIVIGEHEPINKELAKYAGKTVTLRGKVSERDGIHLLANAEVVK